MTSEVHASEAIQYICVTNGMTQMTNKLLLTKILDICPSSHWRVFLKRSSKISNSPNFLRQ